MTRRPPLPGAAELFRPTSGSSAAAAPVTPIGAARSHQASNPPPSRASGSGRQRHDTKITVYLSDDELIALEQARLALRAQHRLGVDRGRIVREAIAVLLADLDEHGENSVLVRRLRG